MRSILFLLAYRQHSELAADLMFTTKRLTAQFKPEFNKEDVDDLISKYDVRIVRKLKYAENAYEMEAPDSDGPNGPVALGNIFMETGNCLWAKASFIKRLHFKTTKRLTPSESNYVKQQWHLKVAKVFEAWPVTKGSPNIRINICDDGIDRNHSEFVSKIVGEYDFELNIADGSHKNNINDRHGTSCAGVAAARGIKASGTAPGCSLIITRTPQQMADADEADMFVWAADNGADIISCSWGPADRDNPDYPPSPAFPLPDETRAAIHYCVTKGRQGKGCCIFWAAGNGYGEPVDDDGYASNPEVMAIAASTNPGRNGFEDKAGYSDIGKAVFLSAPSNGGIKAILTTDRIGSLGYNPNVRATPDQEGNYTDIFGGTSSATPLVAGIAALMLSISPELTVSQVRDILSKKADKIGDKSTYKPEGNNALSHSELYGYGRVNAFEAVKEAQTLARTIPSTLDRMEEGVDVTTKRKNEKIMFLSNETIKQLDESKWLHGDIKSVLVLLHTDIDGALILLNKARLINEKNLRYGIISAGVSGIKLSSDIGNRYLFLAT